MSSAVEAGRGHLGRRVRVTLAPVPAAADAAAEGAGAGSGGVVGLGPTLEADVFAVDAHHGLVVFRNSMATTFMKADYFFVPLARVLAWEDLGEGDKMVVPGVMSETVMKQRYEASRRREEELIECTSKLASESEQRFFMELRKTCVGPLAWKGSSHHARHALPCTHPPPLTPPPPPPPSPLTTTTATPAPSGRGAPLQWTTRAPCCPRPTLPWTLPPPPSTRLARSSCQSTWPRHERQWACKYIVILPQRTHKHTRE